MKYFFIDYENIKQDALKGIERLSAEDKVIVFYSEYAQTITIPMHLQINNSRAEFIFKEVQVGHKNDLDFQLATELGCLVGNGLGDEYYIVSYDKGYQSVCRYWQEKDVCVKRIESLGEGCPQKAAPKKKKKKPAAKPVYEKPVYEEPVYDEPDYDEPDTEAFEEDEPEEQRPRQSRSGRRRNSRSSRNQAKKKDGLFAKVREVVPDQSDAKRVTDILRVHNNKQDVNNALMKEFPSSDNKIAAQLYKLVKPLIPSHKE